MDCYSDISFPCLDDLARDCPSGTDVEYAIRATGVYRLAGDTEILLRPFKLNTAPFG